jgi:molecular chaperone DnaK (HSP70)
MCGGLKNTFYSFKRLLGRQLKDVDASVVDRLMYPLFSTNSGFIAVQCPQTGDLMTPDQLSMLVLGHLIANTERHIEDGITGAVVTVPAMASPDQRSATLAAAKHAGIDVVHLLQEPVAAALAYGINGGTDGDTVLVMDVGGGTFDVSILQAFEGILEVLGTSGDQNLGGDDIDALVADWIMRELEEKGLDLSAIDESWAPLAARKAKEALSVSGSVAVEIPLPRGFPCEEATNAMQLTLTDDTFNELILPLFQRMAVVLENLGYEYHVEWSISPSSAAMASCNIKDFAVNDKSSESQNKVPVPPDPWAPPPRRITKVALVGQTTFIPSIRSFAKVLTGVEPSQGVDPSEAVALGAAIHAGILVGSLDTCELMDGSFNATLHSRVSGFTEWQP